MGQLTRDCPHCHTKSVSLTSFSTVQKEGGRVFVTAFYCNNCFGGYIAEIECPTSLTGHVHKGNIEGNQNLIIKKEYPEAISTASPEYTPENINKFYLQAANALKSGSQKEMHNKRRQADQISARSSLQFARCAGR